MKMTYKEMANLFSEKYPDTKVDDYRPLAPEMFTNHLIGMTITLKNGDILQYYPKEAQENANERKG